MSIIDLLLLIDREFSEISNFIWLHKFLTTDAQYFHCKAGPAFKNSLSKKGFIPKPGILKNTKIDL